MKRYTRTVVSYRTPEVLLRDMDGRDVPVASILGHDGPVMLQFVFTTCPTICGALSGSFAGAQETLVNTESKLRLVSISIDPEHDRPEQLRRYAREFGAGPQWRFYTGRLKDVAAIQKAFDAYRPNKMWHEPLTFMRPKPGAPWVRLTGLMSAGDLTAEYRRMVAP